MMKALIITRHYLDENLGGPNCSKAFVKAVSSLYQDCTLIFPEHNDHVTDLGFLDSKSLTVVPCFDRRSKLKKLLDVYMGRLHRFGKFVSTYLRNNKFDVIFIDHSFTASSGVLRAVADSGSKIVTLHHNVEYRYLRDSKQSIIFRFPYNYFALKAERQAIRLSNLNITLTQQDCDYFKKRFLDKADSFAVLGMFEYAANSKEINASKPSGNYAFVISGALSARQTETAIIDFVNQYLPVLWQECPDGKIIFTGRNPSEKLASLLKSRKNITLISNPVDILAVIGKAHYYICPLFTGSGLKLRIMDGFRNGLPALAHTVSCCGYEALVEKGYMFGYSDKESFRKALRKILTLKVQREEVRSCFYKYFSYEAGKERLRKILIEKSLYPKEEE